MLYHLGNARTEAQTAKMIRLEADGICIFCAPHLGRENGKPVLLSNEAWSLAENEYPYEGALHHFLLIPRRHVAASTELTSAERLGMFELIDRVVAEFGLTYYALGARNGDMRYTGGTIAHLHIQFIVGDPDNPGEPVKLYVSSVPAQDPPSA